MIGIQRWRFWIFKENSYYAEHDVVASFFLILFLRMVKGIKSR